LRGENQINREPPSKGRPGQKREPWGKKRDSDALIEPWPKRDSDALIEPRPKKDPLRKSEPLVARAVSIVRERTKIAESCIHVF